MASRKRKISEEFYEIIEDFRKELCLDDPGIMPPLSHPVFQQLANMFNVSHKVIYLRIKSYKAKNGLLGKEEHTAVDISENQYEQNIDSRSHEEKFEDEITIKLDSKELEQIVPDQRIYENDKYKRVEKTLKPGWTDVICQALWREVKLICCLSFKHVNVTGSGFTTNGNCKECNCNCSVTSNEDFSLLYVKIKPGLKNIVHKQKRKVMGLRRTEIAKSMSIKTATVFRNETANYLMDDDDAEPAILPNTGNHKTTKLRNHKKKGLCLW